MTAAIQTRISNLRKVSSHDVTEGFNDTLRRFGQGAATRFLADQERMYGIWAW